LISELNPLISNEDKLVFAKKKIIIEFRISLLLVMGTQDHSLRLIQVDNNGGIFF